MAENVPGAVARYSDNPVSMLQAIDVWNNICVSFVFLALLEYALVNYAARADTRSGAKTNNTTQQN